jgi:hypothetical protein
MARVKSSTYWMGEVARLATALSTAEKESPNSATSEAIRKAFLKARQKYTNPFNANKYQQ